MTFPAPRQQITIDLFEHETGWSASCVDLKYSATAETLDEIRQMVWDHANVVYDDAQTRTIIWQMHEYQHVCERCDQSPEAALQRVKDTVGEPDDGDGDIAWLSDLPVLIRMAIEGTCSARKKAGTITWHCEEPPGHDGKHYAHAPGTWTSS